MKDIVFGERRGYRDMRISQDCIRWQKFMEGMILRKIVELRKDFVDLGGAVSL